MLVVRFVATLVACAVIVPLPLLASKVTVLFGKAVHWAYKVVSAVNAYEAASTYAVPLPFAEVFQPAKL